MAEIFELHLWDYTEIYWDYTGRQFSFFQAYLLRGNQCDLFCVHCVRCVLCECFAVYCSPYLSLITATLSYSTSAEIQGLESFWFCIIQKFWFLLNPKPKPLAVDALCRTSSASQPWRSYCNMLSGHKAMRTLYSAIHLKNPLQSMNNGFKMSANFS